LPIFDATTYPSIILVQKKRPDAHDKAIAATFMETEQLERLEETLDQITFPMSVTALKKEGWNLEQPDVLALIEKLRFQGVPLAEYVQGRLYRGVLTGLNEAFVIDAFTRENLISEDPASAELIKPWLRGRDIRKWKVECAGLYLINIPSSANRKWPWSNAKNESEAVCLFEQTYPTLHRHLSQWSKQLQKRDDQGKFWWELRSCAYYEAFEKPTITWGNLATEPKFAFDELACYVSAPANIIPTDDLYLLAILNSPLCKWWISLQAAVRAGGFLEYKPMYVGEFPVFQVSNAQKSPIIKFSHAILADPISPSVLRLEAELNNLVYKLYDLTEEEIAIIKGKKK